MYNNFKIYKNYSQNICFIYFNKKVISKGQNLIFFDTIQRSYIFWNSDKKCLDAIRRGTIQIFMAIKDYFLKNS